LLVRVWVIQAVDGEDVWVAQSLFVVFVLLSCLLSRSVFLLLLKYVKYSVVIIVGRGPLICILLFWDENLMGRVTAVGWLIGWLVS
jgi:hypothetical protein